MARKKQASRLTKALLETAEDMYRSGVISTAARDKITMRHLGDMAEPIVEPLSGKEIRRIREQAHMSQAVFARCLKLTTGYVSQLERGTKRPTGPALVLLNAIRRKGIGVIL
jgi:putative transcriptional regulator